MEEKPIEEWKKGRTEHGERKCDQPRTDWEWMRFGCAVGVGPS